MKLDRVTITGADDSVHPGKLAFLSMRFPFVEWGILMSKSQEGGPRFPSHHWISNLQQHAAFNPEMKLSLHLCGSWLRHMLMGRPELPHNRRLGFQRMQLNFHGGNLVYDLGQFISSLSVAGPKEFIFQVDGNMGQQLMADITGEGCQVFSMVPLFDLSHGNGICPDGWPVPFDEKTYHGYAGGLGPDNLAEQIQKIAAQAGDCRVWIDMETKCRSNNDELFDLEKVEQCLTIAERFITA